jgi:hypothetical protein
MAKEVSTTARELGSVSPDLASWLTRDLRVVGATAPSVAPAEPESSALLPPPSLDEAVAGPAAADVNPVSGSAVAASEFPQPPNDERSRAAETATEKSAPIAGAAGAVATAAVSEVASEPAGSGSEWSDDDDAFFSSSPGATGEPVDEERFEDEALLSDAAIGTSLSPQVLESEYDEAAAPLPIPGTGGTPYLKVAVGVAAFLVLLFFFVHHKAAKPPAATAAQPLPAAALDMPAPPETSTAKEAEPAIAAEEAHKATGTWKGGSDFGGKHAPPPDGREDPAYPGGPSVARFPDLPRDILNALEQAFESGDGKSDKTKPRGDSVGGY